MPALPKASVLRLPRKILLVSIFICGINMANDMGSAIDKTCLLVTCTFKSFIVAAASISQQKYLILSS